MILYYITDRRQFPGSPAEQRRRLLDRISEATLAGIDYIQLREKDLTVRELQHLAAEALARVRANGSTKLLINSRTDLAIAAGCDGIHLTGNDISAGDARALWMSASPKRVPLIGVSCHSVADVRMAESQGADFTVLAPIFGKMISSERSHTGTVLPGLSLSILSEACGGLPSPGHTESAPNPPRFPVLALGGVTRENAALCIAAGAAGIAGIRIFQENDIREMVKTLRSRAISY